MVSGGIQIVHRYLLHCSQKARKIWRANNTLLFPAPEPGNTSPTIAQSAHEAFSLRALFHSGRGRASPSTQIRSRADLALPPYTLAAGRLQLPAPSDLLRLRRRGDRTFRALGRWLDDARAPASLQSVRHVGHRQRAPRRAARGTLVFALALRALARRQRPLSLLRCFAHRCPEWNRNFLLALF